MSTGDASASTLASLPDADRMIMSTNKCDGPITQIIAYAFRDRAFENSALTPDIIWRLKVPKRLQSLPLRWKPKKLNTPLLRRLERTPYSYKLHKSLLMIYDSSRQALQELGHDARFKNNISYYNYRR